MDYKRIVLYFALALVALLLWNSWQKEYGTLTVIPAPASVQQASTQNATSISATIASVTKKLQPTAAVKTIIKKPDQENVISIHTDVLNVKINTTGGTIATANLPKYPANLKQPNIPFTMLNSNPATLYTAESGLTNMPGVGDKAIPFTATKKTYTLEKGQKQLAVNLTWEKNGFKVIKTFTFKPGKYVIHVSQRIINNSNKNWEGRFYMQTKRVDAPVGSDHLLGFHTFFGAAISSPSDPYQKIKFKNLKEEPVNKNITGGWMAFIQHYFVSAWIPNPKQSFYYYSQTSKNKLYTLGLMSPKIKLAPKQEKTVRSKFYVGPEIAENLNAVAPHLYLTIDYGWLSFISVIIFWFMKHIYEVVGNWGWAIVLVTMLIKLMLFPLSNISYKSMAKMRALQPKMEGLKERFADDKQSLSRATMELYRKEKVNPLGGCLPMIIQIPVFIALYWVLIESVELRQAPFIFWIHNLSVKDPYYILPILMGGSMFLQQRLSPQPADPTQAKVMMFLPVFFTVLFLNFPSGLVLYWLVNNLTSISQQWWIMRQFSKGAYKKKKKKKKNRA